MGETDFLYKIPSFIDGMSRNIDLFGSFDDYNGSRTPEEADAKAFFYDMAALKGDSRKAFEKMKTAAKQNSE